MENSIFLSAVASISSGDYTEDDIKVIKQRIEALNQKEFAIKRQMERSKNDFVKAKDKSSSELKAVHSDIKKLKNILKSKQ